MILVYLVKVYEKTTYHAAPMSGVKVRPHTRWKLIETHEEHGSYQDIGWWLSDRELIDTQYKVEVTFIDND